jgi:hypothetical protein
MQISKTILDNLVLDGKIQKINARSLGSLDNIKSKRTVGSETEDMRGVCVGVYLRDHSVS